MTTRTLTIHELPFRNPDEFRADMSMAWRTSVALRYNTVMTLSWGDDEAVRSFGHDLLTVFDSAADAREWVDALVTEHNGPAYTSLNRDFPEPITNRFNFEIDPR